MTPAVSLHVRAADGDGSNLHRDLVGAGFGDGYLAEFQLPRAEEHKKLSSHYSLALWLPSPMDCQPAQCFTFQFWT